MILIFLHLQFFILNQTTIIYQIFIDQHIISFVSLKKLISLVSDILKHSGYEQNFYFVNWGLLNKERNLFQLTYTFLTCKFS